MTEVISSLVFGSIGVVILGILYYIQKKPMPETPVSQETPPLETEPPMIDRVGNLDLFASAQRDFEGWFLPGSVHNGVSYPNGSSSFIHKNPGNCKDIHGNFITFKSEADGFQYLKNYILRVRNGEHKAYPKGGDTTISEYCHRYTGDPEPSPTNYANYISRALKTFPSTKLRDVV